MTDPNHETFRARLQARLARLYDAPQHDVEALAGRIEQKVNEYLDRTTSAQNAPERNEAAAGWDQRDAVLITYGDMVRPAKGHPLEALGAFLRNRLDGVVNAVHILPFFPYSSDDGFSVIDYRAVDPALGDWDDVRAIGERFGLMFDLVLNHVSSQSRWFADYRRGVAPASGFFIEVSPDADLSNVVRPRSLPLLTEVRTDAGTRHVWTTFSDDQIDLNFANPEVLIEFLDILLGYAAAGARIVRLDAIAYLWKKIGTSCIHLPQTHEVVKLMRDVLDAAEPGVWLLTETNVPHRENVSYFGQGDEARIVYQFSAAPLILHALLRGDARWLSAWARDLEPPPEGCTYLNFTASHDGIGVRPMEGLAPDEEVAWLAEEVRRRGGRVSTRRNADGTDSPYELNVAYTSALADPDAPEFDVDRFICSQAIMLALRGIPAVYFHSLVGTRNDEAGVEATGRARSINRRKWDAEELEAALSDPASGHARIFEALARLLRLRREQAAFHPDAPQRVLDLGESIFALTRTPPPDGGRPLVALHNVTDAPVTAAVDLADAAPQVHNGGPWRDLLGGRTFDGPSVAIELTPYQICWLTPSG